MGIAERVYELVQGLPESSARQVLEFTRGKYAEGRHTAALVKPSAIVESVPSLLVSQRLDATAAPRASARSPIFPGLPVS
jgi:hypothetical protein